MSELTPQETQITTAGETAGFDPDRIMAALDAAFSRLPEAEIREARQHREVMVPRLIQAIRDVTAKVRAGEKVTGEAHFFALFLLGEFKAREALPAILEAISLPGEGPHDIFGDAITTGLSSVLARLPDDPLALIDTMIPNAALNEFVRWEAAQVYSHLIHDGRLTREEAVARLGEHLRREVEREDMEIVSALICCLSDLAPREVYGDIKEAFRRKLVDESMVDLSSVDRGIADGEAGVQQYLQRLRGVDDTIEELRRWASFQPKRPAAAEPIEQTEMKGWLKSLASGRERPAPEPEPRPEPAGKPAPIVPGKKKVGRNEPCPCGSGKKFKKCCGQEG